MRTGFAADFPCAIVENGARPEQRRLATTLGDAAACIAREGLRSPAVFVVGRVCELADRFDWFSRLPMRGRRVLAAPDAACLSERLRELGARVVDMPAPKVAWLPFELPRPGGALLLDGATAVEALSARLDALQLDARALAGCRLICRPAAARALRSHGLRADEVVEDWPGSCCARRKRPGENRRAPVRGRSPGICRRTRISRPCCARREKPGESSRAPVQGRSPGICRRARILQFCCARREKPGADLCALPVRTPIFRDCARHGGRRSRRWNRARSSSSACRGGIWLASRAPQKIGMFPVSGWCAQI